MSFDEWWKANEGRLEGELCFEFNDDVSLAKQAAEIAWNAQEERVETLRGIALKAIKKNRAFRETLKQTVTRSCLKRGRCVSKRVDEDFCTVCRPIMNVLSDHDPTPDEVIKAICEDNLD